MILNSVFEVVVDAFSLGCVFGVAATVLFCGSFDICSDLADAVVGYGLCGVIEPVDLLFWVHESFDAAGFFSPDRDTLLVESDGISVAFGDSVVGVAKGFWYCFGCEIFQR